MNIEEYRHTDGMRRWELLFEGLYLVLLNEGSPQPYSSQLLAFDGFGSLSWSFSPQTEHGNDHITNIWVKGNYLYAGSYSGFRHKLDYKSGKVIETVFTK